MAATDPEWEKTHAGLCLRDVAESIMEKQQAGKTRLLFCIHFIKRNKLF